MSKYILYFNNLDSAESHVILSLPFSSYIEEENMAIFSESGGVIQNGNITTNNCIFYSSTDSKLNLSQSAFTNTILYDRYNDGVGILYTNQVITSIPDYTFYQCKELITVVLPDSVTKIGRNAFSGCLSLKSLEIPINVTSVGTSLIPTIIQDCPNLESIIWNSKQFSNDASKLISDIVKMQITSFTFGENVEYIPSSLCKNMRNITSITIPNSVTSIGTGAFASCMFTKENFINNSLLDAAANNYWGATVVTGKEIDGVIMNEMRIIGCRPSVTNLLISAEIGLIQANAFYGCSKLTTITCESTTPPTLQSLNNKLSTVTAVYVPAESVDLYKTATNWSYYSGVIKPI